MKLFVRQTEVEDASRVAELLSEPLPRDLRPEGLRHKLSPGSNAAKTSY
jgi:hypothetical protein